MNKILLVGNFDECVRESVVRSFGVVSGRRWAQRHGRPVRVAAIPADPRQGRQAGDALHGELTGGAEGS